MANARLAVVVYGATGFTGRLVVERLAQRGVSFAIAGRPSEALRTLASRHRVRAVVAELSDTAAMTHAFSCATVALACAGPFAKTGAALVDAAMRARTHLIDLSGEPDYLLETLARDAEVRAAGVAVVHSVGFDVVPAELLAHLCQKPLGPGVHLTLATAHTPGVPSRGTLESYRAMVGRGLSWVDGALVEEPLAAHRRVVAFPPPLGERAAVSVGSAEVVLLGRSLGARSVRHLIGTLAPAALAVAERGLPTFSEEGLVSSLQHLAQARRSGPDEATRAQSQFALWCQASAAGGTVRTMTMNGADPYGLSATLAVACAETAGQPSFMARGVLTPIQAFEPQPLLAVLAHHGVRWRPMTAEPQDYPPTL